MATLVAISLVYLWKLFWLMKVITSHRAPNPTNGKMRVEKRRVKWRKWTPKEEATLLHMILNTERRDVRFKTRRCSGTEEMLVVRIGRGMRKVQQRSIQNCIPGERWQCIFGGRRLIKQGLFRSQICLAQS
jgi:hypothetical protein